MRRWYFGRNGTDVSAHDCAKRSAVISNAAPKHADAAPEHSDTTARAADADARPSRAVKSNDSRESRFCERTTRCIHTTRR